MKKTMIALSLISIFYACSDSTGTEKNTSNLDKNDATQNPVYQAGFDLAAKSGCPTCHKVDEASTGPSFKSIATKYTNDAATYENLSLKIIKGGSGVWGQIPMTPHPELSQDDATKMVKYIMLLKN